MAQQKKTNKKENGMQALKVILVGEGGQGIQTIAKVVSRAAFNSKYHASYIPNFGTEQRGGLSLSFVQIATTPIISPKFKTADLFIIVTNRNIERTTRYIGKNTNVLYDADLLNEKAVNAIKRRTTQTVPVRAFHQATEKLTERSFNVILTGILTGIIDHSLEEEVLKVMDEKFEKYYAKDPALKKSNHEAFAIGLNLTKPS
jgi:2-oxoglutarate ferredoxin oxidoreductase subunit gamma